MATEQQPLPKGGGDDRKLGHIAYLLYALGIIIAPAAVGGVILAHIKAGEAQGVLPSHFQWLIRTFWIGLGAAILAFILMHILIGFPLMIAVAVWYIYRVVKGWLRLNEGRAIDSPTAFF